MRYTYNDLLKMLKELDAEDLEKTLTVMDVSIMEYYPARFDITCGEDDVIDANHPVIVINEELME